MDYSYTDYLFILSIYNEPVPLGKVLSHLVSSGVASHEAHDEARDKLLELAGAGLVRVSDAEGAFCIELTRSGRKVTENIAQILVDDMIGKWRAQYSEPGLPQPILA